jgi:hypothetical protein
MVIPVKRKPEQASSEASVASASSFPPAGMTDWDAEAELRRIERKLRDSLRQRKQENATADRRLRLDAAHPDVRPSKQEKLIRPKAKKIAMKGRTLRTDIPKAKKTAVAKSSSLLAFLTWSVIFLGITALLGGGIALGCSLYGDRPDFWNFGLPFAIGGQIVLLVGLVMQLDRLWRDNRAAAAKLDEVDEELHDLKSSASLLGAAHRSASGSFYAHYAGGANTQLLLTDLKSQLDLLALKIAQED